MISKEFPGICPCSIAVSAFFSFFSCFTDLFRDEIPRRDFDFASFRLSKKTYRSTLLVSCLSLTLDNTDNFEDNSATLRERESKIRDLSVLEVFQSIKPPSVYLNSVEFRWFDKKYIQANPSRNSLPRYIKKKKNARFDNVR